MGTASQPRRASDRRLARRRERVWLLAAALAAVLLSSLVAYRVGYRRGVASVPGIAAHASARGQVGSRTDVTRIARVIWQQPRRRAVTEVVLHHTWRPTAKQFRGTATVASILRYHSDEQGYGNLAYHYLIDPQGGIWLGRPLAEDGTHTKGRNERTVAVCLILDGDTEPVGAAQRRAAGVVLATLLRRFGLQAAENFANDRGFHRDYQDKTCPGAKITKAQVRGWVAEAQGAG